MIMMATIMESFSNRYFDSDFAGVCYLGKNGRLSTLSRTLLPFLKRDLILDSDWQKFM
jgi:hypothetical protein